MQEYGSLVGREGGSKKTALNGNFASVIFAVSTFADNIHSVHIQCIGNLRVSLKGCSV
jgi:hypothetical protein